MDLFSQRNASHKKVRSRINQDRHAFFEWQFIVAPGRPWANGVKPCPPTMLQKRLLPRGGVSLP
jgi:hypothetical protein